MDWSALVQLGGLGVLAVLLVIKDGKRDVFMQKLIERMQTSLDKNTDAINALKNTIERNEK